MSHRGFAVLFALTLVAPVGVRAQHEGHAAPPAATEPPADEPHAAHEPADEATHAEHAEGTMRGLFGPYSMRREASGTSWQPDAAPMHGAHTMHLGWMVMTHGWANLVYSDQGGRRGDSELFATSMAMGTAWQQRGEGTIGLRVMLSADPVLVGKEGYPLLFQTGETADGRTPLVDRQHPHDLFMELAASYSRALRDDASWFLYGALAGEPALGPPTFMHRFSGVDNPEAPLGHHWLDSTHISFGVVTGGVVLDRFKLDASLFNGREPDEERYDIELRALDSEAIRVSFNPSESWSLQASRGWLDSPEQLEPGVDVVRTTASVIYHHAGDAPWEVALAWGRNEEGDEAATDAWLLDGAWRLAGRHTLYGRLERVENDDLFEEDHPLHGRTFEIVKLAVGYLHRFPLGPRASWGVGGQVAQQFTPRALDDEYSSDPTSFLLFARIETGGAAR